MQIREGGYSDWVFARAERLRLDRAAEERRRNLARKELAWLRRGPPARTSKPRYRIEAAEALIADVPEPRNTVELAHVRPPAARQGRARSGGRDRRPCRRPTATRTLLTTSPGGSARATGSASSGSTGRASRRCCGCWSASCRRTRGRSSVGRTVRLGYLSQEVVELPGELRLLEAVTEIAGMVNLGGKDLDRRTAGRAVRLHRRPSSGPGWRSCPAASAAGCSCCGS